MAEEKQTGGVSRVRSRARSMLRAGVHRNFFKRSCYVENQGLSGRTGACHPRKNLSLPDDFSLSCPIHKAVPCAIAIPTAERS